MRRALALGLVAFFTLAGALIVRGLRRVPLPSRDARAPLTDMAPRAKAFDPGLSPSRPQPVAAAAPARNEVVRPAESPRAPVPPALMSDPANPPQGTSPLAIPDPPKPPNPFDPPPMTVDPWAQRRQRPR